MEHVKPIWADAVVAAQKAAEVGVSELTDLLSADKQMSPEEFKRQYLGEFKPDPVIEDCVAFLRHATPMMIADYKRKGIFPKEAMKAARKILEAESR